MDVNGFRGLQLENYRPLRDVVFDHLRNSILNGELKPGERLMEVQLAGQLGVSRTPVREAIRKLELEGLVVMIARKGAYVADLSVKDILDVIEVRSVLEGLAASLAADRMSGEDVSELKEISNKFKACFEEENADGMIEQDRKFHECILKSTRNSKLIQINQGLQEQIHRFRIIYFSEYSQAKDLLEEHEEILNAIIRRDPIKAKEIAATHVENIGNSIVEIENIKKSSSNRL
ncbi:MAG: GntR family transcriptional regulator [Anaeromicrobium sp.]|jgi:DNA-binding GntR family transcriptional regulator|uniref:GntR family transcriptional regulator n=1 Tax=Anaeromicrobium sp. TaxID=1929132 RepID=UPI0025F460AD|nr:GntR family transcriptional regulator [Anaeromicrobium sp.]MCT4593287.1 GntR family transcriptional regulator [Anaeromicrobium sp.]